MGRVSGVGLVGDCYGATVVASSWARAGTRRVRGRPVEVARTAATSRAATRGRATAQAEGVGVGIDGDGRRTQGVMGSRGASADKGPGQGPEPILDRV